MMMMMMMMRMMMIEYSCIPSHPTLNLKAPHIFRLRREPGFRALISFSAGAQTLPLV